MPSNLALLLCICIILYLFRLESRRVDAVSKATLIPLIWMFLGGSRYVSQWLNLSGPAGPGNVYLEGSPVDRAVFLGLMILGVIVLLRRHLDWKALATGNAFILLYFAFGAISILWSDYPDIAFKRWIKAQGNVIMALILLTDPRPYEAVGSVLRRLAYIALPLSVLFIKYYPDLGRAYHLGEPMYTGVALQKNGLGVLCLLSGIYLAWTLLLRRESARNLQDRGRHLYWFLLLAMTAWLFYMADSATATACMAITLILLALARSPRIRSRPRRFFHLILVSGVLVAFAEMVFGVSEVAVRMLGRRPDLTTRVPMWEDLLGMVQNPLFGFGFESFWLGERQEIVHETWGISLSAHNGYLEMYLNLGVVGVFFVIIWIICGLVKVYRILPFDYDGGVLGLCVVLVVALYNWTEASFYGVSGIWVLFLTAVMEAPVVRKTGPALIESPPPAYPPWLSAPPTSIVPLSRPEQSRPGLSQSGP